MLNLPVRTPTWQNKEGERERNDFSKTQEENNFIIPSLPDS